MSMSWNEVTVAGNITRPIELKYLASGSAVCEVGLAINEKYKGNDGNWVETVVFVDISCFGRNAEVVSEYCDKGSPLFVRGKLKLDQWEKDGKKQSKLRIVADRIQLLGSRNGGEQEQPRQQSQRRSAGASNRQSAPPPPEDDVPF